MSKISAADDLRAHPWFGVTKQALSLAEERSLLNTLQVISTSASEIERQVETLRVENGLDVQCSELALNGLLSIEARLPAINAGLRKDLLQPLSNPSLRTEMRAFGDLLICYRGTRDSLVRHFGKVPELNVMEIEILKNSCGQAVQLEVGAMTISELKHHAKWVESFADYLSRTSIIFEQVCRHLNCSFSFDAGSVSVLTKAIALLDDAPLHALHLRHSTLERDGIEPVIAQAHQEAETLRKQAEEISTRIDWNLAPARELLARHAVVCSNAGIFSFVTKGFRSARKDWRGMTKRGRKASGEQMAQDYRGLIQYFDDLNNFTSNHQCREALGPLFNGLKTPFAELAQLAKWYELVKERLGVGSEAAWQASAALFAELVASFILHKTL